MDLDNLQTFHGLFSNWRFHIPDYQRGYAWGKAQWQDLMDDLSTLTEDNDHFTGLLVLHENKDPNLRLKARGITKDIFDIVDGQQRLTTVIILLNEIRREMQALKMDDLLKIAESIEQIYLFEPISDSLKVFQLILDSNNHAFFTHNILGTNGQDIGGPQMQSHYNLLGARDFFQDELRQKHRQMKESYPAWLEAFYGKISKQMKVMVYLLRSEADAGVVFESMNSRGKKPNQLDLVKNYLLFLASKLDDDLRLQVSTDINQAWTVIFEKLSAAGRPDDEDTLLEMHWVTTYDYDRKHWAAAPEKSDHIKKRFKEKIIHPELHIQMATEVTDYVQTLKNTAIAYRDILQPEHSQSFQIFKSQPGVHSQVVRFSEKLVRLGTLRPFIPLLVALRLRYPENAAQYLEAVQICEKYAFRVFRVANARTSSSEALLFRLANQIYQGKLTPQNAFEEMRRNLLERCSDTVLQRSFDINELKPWYGRSGLKYFLFEYEEHLFGDGKPVFAWSAVIGGQEKTIEHILPQTPEAESDWLKIFSAEEVEKYRHVLGNLTMTEDNSKLGRKSFIEKKGQIGQANACYANSILKIERELAGLKDWTPTEIENRQRRLAEWALQRWYVDPPPPMSDNLFEALKQRAEKNGFGEEFRQIHRLAERLKLLPKANKQRMSYKSPRNNLWSVLKIYTYASGIDASFNFQFFPKYTGVPEERIREIFGNRASWWLPPDQVPGFINRLKQLADEVESQGWK